MSSYGCARWQATRHARGEEADDMQRDRGLKVSWRADRKPRHTERTHRTSGRAETRTPKPGTHTAGQDGQEQRQEGKTEPYRSRAEADGAIVGLAGNGLEFEGRRLVRLDQVRVENVEPAETQLSDSARLQNVNGARPRGEARRPLTRRSHTNKERTTKSGSDGCNKAEDRCSKEAAQTQAISPLTCSPARSWAAGFPCRSASGCTCSTRSPS